MSFRPKSPHGAYSLRKAAQEMLKYADRYGRRLKEQIPDANRGRYEAALAQVIQGCEILLDIQFKGEIDPNSQKDVK